MKREEGKFYRIIDDGQSKTSGLDLLRQDLREQHGEDYVVELMIEIVRINKMAHVLKVEVTEKQLREGALNGIMVFKCPNCDDRLVAEPDAQNVCCQHCDKLVAIVNPYF